MVASRAQELAIERVDIAVYSKDDDLELIVEVKNRANATQAWAAAMRRNLIAHLDIPASPFFLLALPDHFFLWKGAVSSLDAIPPDYDADPAPLLSPYVGDTSNPLSGISEFGLELAVSSWLTNLINSTLDETTSLPYHAWIFESGLYYAIKGGSVRPSAVL